MKFLQEGTKSSSRFRLDANVLDQQEEIPWDKIKQSSAIRYRSSPNICKNRFGPSGAGPEPPNSRVRSAPVRAARGFGRSA